MMKRMMAMAVMTLAISFNAMAQQAKVNDKDIVGVWLMESMQWEGEKKIVCGTSESNYTQVKVYRANGEYACAEIAKNGSTFVVMPHEYGSYTFKNGKYTEMGREGILIMVDKNTFEGRWNNRHDVWKKAGIPEKLTNYVVERCKEHQGAPADIQKLIGQYMFRK